MKYIYLRTNLVNGKQYVGQTNDFKNRERTWKCLKGSYANKYIDEDREKYGIDNFKSEIILECEDEKTDYWEQYYIEKYNTKYPYGYNVADGGILGGWNKGIPMSEEARMKLSNTNKGKPRKHKSKTVYQFTLEGELVKEWKTLKDCNKDGFHKGNIYDCCNGKRKTHKGFIWKN